MDITHLAAEEYAVLTEEMQEMVSKSPAVEYFTTPLSAPMLVLDCGGPAGTIIVNPIHSKAAIGVPVKGIAKVLRNPLRDCNNLEFLLDVKNTMEVLFVTKPVVTTLDVKNFIMKSESMQWFVTQEMVSQAVAAYCQEMDDIDFRYSSDGKYKEYVQVAYIPASTSVSYKGKSVSKPSTATGADREFICSYPRSPEEVVVAPTHNKARSIYSEKHGTDYMYTTAKVKK
jgi:hypothetical protein